MKLDKEHMQSLASAILDTYNLTDLTINREMALHGLREDLLSEFEDLNSAATKAARLDHFEIAGASLDDYSEKVLCFDKDRKVVFGIRHMGGNRDVPFVQFTPNFSISSKGEALKLYEIVKPEVKVFHPVYIRFWTKAEIDTDFFGSIYMVSTANRIEELKPWQQESQLEFADIADDSYYDWYRKGYDEFHADFPELEKKITVNSIETMRDSLEHGLLKFVIVDGENVGIIAAEKNQFLGHDGIYFNEIYIQKRWKGKGLAKAIQRKFIEKFSQGHEFIWGTIDSSNIPSYKTAFSNGRRPIRYECFVKLTNI